MISEQFLILVVGAHLSERQETLSLLRSSGYAIRLVDSARELDEALSESETPAVALVDPKDPVFSGYEAISILREKSPETQLIVVSRKHSTKEALEAQSRGAFCYFSEPLEVEEFLFLIVKAIVVFELAIKNRELKTAISGTSEVNFIGQGVEAQKLFKRIQRIASVDTTVLITGETGTGKTALARLIHSKSSRHTEPFISLSCASIPRDLLEAEFFGFERGAFTGAVSRKIGNIELADKGTLFLDEIGELPLELQPKLLTFLQDRQIRRLGGSKSFSVDVRIIAATNRNLEALVEAKAFRQDLLFRMNVVSIELPRLAARTDDIQLLAENFLERLSKLRGEKPVFITKDALEQLKRYSWPGNIRELENVLERASLFCSGNRITPDDLGLPVGPPSSSDIKAENNMTLGELERRAIEMRLKYFSGNKQETAKSLGISLKTIYNKMRGYGLT